MFLFFRLSLFHLEHQPQTGKGLSKLLAKHYSKQVLFELHTLIFGLDVLGNPVSVVRGVVFGAKDLFYEPFKVGSCCVRVCVVCLSVVVPLFVFKCLFVCCVL